MKIQAAYYRGHARYGFHSDEQGEIVGVRWVTPHNNGAEPRACFVVRFANGDEDYFPLNEAVAQGYIGAPPAQPGDSAKAGGGATSS